VCTAIDELEPARPAGFFRRLWDRLTDRQPEPTGPPPAEAPILSPAAIDNIEAWQQERDRQSGRPMCAKCGSRRDVDGGVLHRRWCQSCDTDWLEDTIAWPLVARMGRKKARELLLAVVRGELRLCDRKTAI
jgi:hypothetical protein